MPESFDEVKKSVVSAPLLHPPEWEKGFFSGLVGVSYRPCKGNRVAISLAPNTCYVFLSYYSTHTLSKNHACDTIKQK